MADLGFREVYSLQGGIEQWKKVDLPWRGPLRRLVKAESHPLYVPPFFRRDIS
jgi:3-mercaptopyruvate sulfurtransferase SseA